MAMSSVSSSAISAGGRVVIKQINGFLGAEIWGVDLRELLSEGVIQARCRRIR